MAAVKEVGVVVVGLGVAGKVRVRDLKEDTCSLRLVGAVSRRPVELDGVRAFELDEAVKHPDVDALIIATEPALHEEYVRKGLENGKHVLVEYPLAPAAKTVKELFQLAEDKGLVLQEENIALLTDSFKVVQEKARQVDLKCATYSIKGSYNGWIEDFDKSGLPFVTGITAIQTMLALFGDLKVLGGKLEKSDDGFSAHAELETKNGKPISITFARSKAKSPFRQKYAVYEFEDGEVIDTNKISQMKSGKPGLFMQDMHNFCDAIKEGKILEENKFLAIRGIEIAEQIHAFF